MSLRTIVSATMLAAAAVFAMPVIAEPTIHEVYQAAESGNLAQAQRMMNEVLRAHPDSAKAHYVEAELLTKQGQLSAAAAELNTAERLDPGLPFAKPEAVRELKARMASTGRLIPSASPGVGPAASGGFSWGTLLLGGALLALIALAIGAVMNRRKAAAASAGSVLPYGSTASAQSSPTATPAAGGPAGSGMGSRILGGLATGAAVGAGIVAGEALADRLMGGHHGEGNVLPRGGDVPQSDLGGNDFGVADNTSWDDGLGGIGGDVGGDWS